MLGELLPDAIAAINGHPLLSLGVLILAGYVFGRLCQLLRLPTITGYIVAGLVVSDSVAGIVDHHTVASLAPITEVALSFIAITIGGEFHFAKLRRTGGKILAITLFEAIFAAVMVSTVLGFLLLPFSYALLLGAIAAATAPAATVVIVRDLRARGEFVDYLFGVVAFDDAVSVLLFSIGFAVGDPTADGRGDGRCRNPGRVRARRCRDRVVGTGRSRFGVGDSRRGRGAAGPTTTCC